MYAQVKRVCLEEKKINNEVRTEDGQVRSEFGIMSSSSESDAKLLSLL